VEGAGCRLPGDSILSEFAGVGDAAQCSVEINASLFLIQGRALKVAAPKERVDG
jgi:hypothetical protein